MNQEKIGNFIAKCRKEKNITQSELAEKLGVTDRSISNWENGKNMPDLSLFKPLCKELEITINELMCGEKVSENDYQSKLEENIIDLTLKTKSRINKKNKITICVIFILFILFIGGLYIYNYFELNVSYDENMMKCSFVEDKLNYTITGVSVLNTNYVEREIDNNKIYIFHSTINVYNKRRSNYDYGKSLSNLIGGKKIPFEYFLELNEESAKYDNVIVYYTNKPLAKINKLNNEELSKELTKSYKMCSLN